jgi:hypothetical protein
MEKEPLKRTLPILWVFLIVSINIVCLYPYLVLICVLYACVLCFNIVHSISLESCVQATVHVTHSQYRDTFTGQCGSNTWPRIWYGPIISIVLVKVEFRFCSKGYTWPWVCGIGRHSY